MRDFKQSANKQLTIVLSCLLIAFLLIGVFAVSNAFNSKEKKILYAEVITVSDLDELLAVLEDSTANTTIIVTDRIDITLQDQDIELDGHGATITVPEPFVNPDGTLNENASDFGVFYFDVGNFSLKNMTIIGGGDAKYFAGMYAVRLKHGNLTMENVTITNSNGGLMVSDGNVALKIPAGTQPGTKLRLRGRGTQNPKNKNGQRGDQYVICNVVVPTNLTQEEKKLIEELSNVEKKEKKSPWEKFKSLFK